MPVRARWERGGRVGGGQGACLWPWNRVIRQLDRCVTSVPDLPPRCYAVVPVSYEGAEGLCEHTALSACLKERGGAPPGSGGGSPLGGTPSAGSPSGGSSSGKSPSGVGRGWRGAVMDRFLVVQMDGEAERVCEDPQ